MSWRYARRRTDMNFPEIESREKAEMLALPQALTTPQEKRRYRRASHRLAIAEADERAMAELMKNHLDDTEMELKFYTARKADTKKERAYKRRKKAYIEG
jgi:hypothetical protein